MRLPRHKNKRHTKNKTTKKSAELADFFCFSDNISCRFIKDDVALSDVLELIEFFPYSIKIFCLRKPFTPLSKIAFARALLAF